ncbi:MAG TPA: 2-phospho-L-lactate guanylyltransferase [Dehalococcoidia bacterium]|nr:2-phospho-L-lactate guanylyltransferase [Dehalococcoidia bacterium]
MRAALIPVKELAQAKMRLADVLDRRARSELALAMLTDVITACGDSASFDVIAIVSSDTEALWHARELGARPIAEPAALHATSGAEALNTGLTFAARYLHRRVGVDELVILPADIPLALPADIRTVADTLAGADGPRVVIAPAADNGTNALALRPPLLIPMRFGRDSAEAHRRTAIDAGVEPIVLNVPALRFDVDSPEDLRALDALPAGAATRGWLDARAHELARRSQGAR